ncbi:MAG: hypothetical protein VCD00_11030 [Candidatus Hydrogenedentota bacterium]
MKWLIGITIIMAGALSAGEVVAQSKTANFKRVMLHEAGKAYLNYKSGQFIQSLEQGVHLTFVAEDEANNMEVKATKIVFDYTDSKDDSVSKMILTGDVIIRNAELQIEAPKAIINIVTMNAEFIGESKIIRENGEVGYAESIQIDLDTGMIEMDKLRIDNLELIKK